VPDALGKTEIERRIERYEALLRVNDVVAKFADVNQLSSSTSLPVFARSSPSRLSVLADTMLTKA
jgi:hypothetical protein